MDKDKLFHFGRSRPAGAMMRGDEQFFLSSTSRSSASAPETDAKRRGGRRTKRSNEERGDSTTAPTANHWTCAAPIQVRAMVLSKDTLFIAGPKGDWMHSADAFEGRNGVAQLAISAATGEIDAEYSLPSLPVFDGMIAARRNLYLSLTDGSIVCFGNK
jgi:hypothetical protein